MKKPAKRPPGRPRGFSREAALDRAIPIFWAKGYDAASFRDLTSAMGISPPSLMAAFGDKHALFSQVVDFYFARVLQPMVDLLDAPGSARANIERLFQGWEDYVCSPLFQGCLVDRALDEGTAAAASA